MARIYKGTQSNLQLYLKREDITNINKITFYTTDVNQSVEIYDGIVIEDDKVKVDTNTSIFEHLNDGVLSYVIEGDGVVVERQSSYYVKTPISNPTTSIQLRKEETYSESGQFIITPDSGYKGLSEVIVNVDTDEYYNKGYQEGNTEGYNNGYNQGKNDGYADGRQTQLDLLEEITITENGVYQTENGYNPVNVNIPFGRKTITENCIIRTENGYLAESYDVVGETFRYNGGGHVIEHNYNLDTKVEVLYKPFNAAGEFFGGEIRGIFGVQDTSRNINFYVAEDANDPSNIFARVGDWESDRFFITDSWHLISLSGKEFCIDGEVVATVPDWVVPFDTTAIFLNGIYEQPQQEHHYYPNVGFYSDVKIWQNDELVGIFKPTVEDGIPFYVNILDNYHHGQYWRITQNFIAFFFIEEHRPKKVRALEYIEVAVPEKVIKPLKSYRPSSVSELISVDKVAMVRASEDGVDGYSIVGVECADILNEEYNRGKAEGGINIVNNARELYVNENGTYYTDYSEGVGGGEITGYINGEPQYSYRVVEGAVFETGIPAYANSRLEFWWKDDHYYDHSYMNGTIIGAQNGELIFKVCKSGPNYKVEYSNHYTYEVMEETFDLSEGWHHFIVSRDEGFIVDDVKLFDLIQITEPNEHPTFWINASWANETDYNGNGTFGVIYIDGHYISSMPNSFLNLSTDEYLERVKEGYDEWFSGSVPAQYGGMFKTVIVDVQPKIDVAASKLTFSYSKMTEIPKVLDFSGVSDFSNMFRECINLIITDDFTSNLRPINLSYAFYNLQNMTKFPIINLEDVEDFGYAFYNWKNAEDTSECYNWYLPKCKSFTSSTRGWDKVSDWSFLSNWGITKDANIGDMISGDGAITVPAIENDASSANGNCIFSNSYSDKQKLTYFGGYIGRKASIDNNYHYVRMPNLTYESCISILNNLYDFEGHSETPSSSQGKLKVHQNFIDTVGEEISIGVNKGWLITV